MPKAKKTKTKRVYKDSDRLRPYVFVWNNYTPEDIEHVKNVLHLATYVCFGKEVGEECGTPHLQGYCYYENKIMFGALKKKLHHAWVEPAEGTALQNLTYCSKQDKHPYEYGLMPMQGKRTDLTEFVESVRRSRPDEGVLLEEWPTVTARYPTFVERVIDHYHPPQDMEPGTLDNYWIYGPSNTGKSTEARRIAALNGQRVYLKSMNKWFDNYDNEESILLEDLGDSQAVQMQYYLKIWADRYVWRGEIKGRSKLIRPRRLIVTSNYHIMELGLDARTTAALLRRFRMIEMNIIFAEKK